MDLLSQNLLRLAKIFKFYFPEWEIFQYILFILKQHVIQIQFIWNSY